MNDRINVDKSSTRFTVTFKTSNDDVRELDKIIQDYFDRVTEFKTRDRFINDIFTFLKKHRLYASRNNTFNFNFFLLITALKNVKLGC